MKTEPNTEAAKTVQTTNVPAVELPRLVHPLNFESRNDNESKL